MSNIFLPFLHIPVDRKEDRLTTAASWRWVTSSWRSTAFLWEVGSTRMLLGSLLRPSRPKRRTTLTSWWLNHDSSMRTVHFMQLSMGRHSFTALRESYELNHMMLSYNNGPHFNFRERIYGNMCQVFVDCTQWFGIVRFKKGYCIDVCHKCHTWVKYCLHLFIQYWFCFLSFQALKLVLYIILWSLDTKSDRARNMTASKHFIQISWSDHSRDNIKSPLCPVMYTTMIWRLL